MKKKFQLPSRDSALVISAESGNRWETDLITACCEFFAPHTSCGSDLIHVAKLVTQKKTAAENQFGSWRNQDAHLRPTAGR
jgi:hypothetical protein